MKKLLILVALLVSSAQAQEMTHRYFQYSPMLFTPTTMCISGNTADGADSQVLQLAPGGACDSPSRSPYLTMYSNEHASTGDVYLSGGQAGAVVFQTGDNDSNTSRTRLTIPDDNSSFNVDLALGSSSTTAPVFTIRGQTGVDDDDGILALTPGNACDGGEAGCAQITGNEYASTGFKGVVLLLGGNGTANANDGSVMMGPRSTYTWRFLGGGDLTQDAASGGSIVMSKAGTYLSSGTVPYTADVTTAIGAAPDIFSGGISANHNLVLLSSDTNAAYGPFIDFMLTRKNDGTADTIVANNDVLGYLQFHGANGADFKPAAKITVEVDGTPGASNDMPGRIVFATSPDGAASPAEAMRISQDKSVLIAGTLDTSATSLGWRVAAGADTACTTTCGVGKGCVFGQNTAALTYAIVDCADAAADICICTTT